MFARFVSMRLKNGNLTEFNRILEKEVIPLLQRQKGFREEIVLANPSAAEVVGISIDRKSTRLNSSHLVISYAVFCLKKKKPPLAPLHRQRALPMWFLLPIRPFSHICFSGFSSTNTGSSQSLLPLLLPIHYPHH